MNPLMLLLQALLSGGNGGGGLFGHTSAGQSASPQRPQGPQAPQQPQQYPIGMLLLPLLHSIFGGSFGQQQQPGMLGEPPMPGKQLPQMQGFAGARGATKNPTTLGGTATTLPGARRDEPGGPIGLPGGRSIGALTSRSAGIPGSQTLFGGPPLS